MNFREHIIIVVLLLGGMVGVAICDAVLNDKDTELTNGDMPATSPYTTAWLRTPVTNDAPIYIEQNYRIGSTHPTSVETHASVTATYNSKETHSYDLFRSAQTPQHGTTNQSQHSATYTSQHNVVNTSIHSTANAPATYNSNNSKETTSYDMLRRAQTPQHSIKNRSLQPATSSASSSRHGVRRRVYNPESSDTDGNGNYWDEDAEDWLPIPGSSQPKVGDTKLENGYIWYWNGTEWIQGSEQVGDDPKDDDPGLGGMYEMWLAMYKSEYGQDASPTQEELQAYAYQKMGLGVFTKFTPLGDGLWLLILMAVAFGIMKTVKRKVFFNMKRTKLYLLIATICALPFGSRVSAANYELSGVTLTKSTSTLNTTSVLHLPTDYATTLFDASGKATMHQLYILSTLTTAAGHTVGGVTLAAGDWLFSYKVNAAGNGYVMDIAPFDPTLTALPPVDINTMKASLNPSGTNVKVYITGNIQHNVKAELPETAELLNAPSYINDYKQDVVDAILTRIHTNIQNTADITFKDLSFHENTEGFFYFTGDQNTALDLYLDNLTIGVQDKKIDFLGMMMLQYMRFNLAGLDAEVEPYDMSDYDVSVFSQLTQEQVQNDITPAQAAGMSNAQLDALQNIQWLVSAQVAALSANQILHLKDKLSATQYTYITPAQVTKLKAANANLSQFNATQKATLENASSKEVVIPRVLSHLSSRLSSVNNIIGSDLTIEVIASLFKDLIQGTASPFAFSSESEYTNNPLKVNIHSKGENVVAGGARAEFKNIVEEMTYVAGSNTSLKNQLEELSTIFQQVVAFTSAPLSVRPSAHVVKLGESDNYNYTITRLTFDDIWTINGTANTHVNGLLCLPVIGNDLDAPSIDLGTPRGKVVFNSGQYKFHTPVSNKVKNMFYVASMSICYRELAIQMPLVGKITYSGIGSSVGTGPSGTLEDNYVNVEINDGTFDTYSSEAWKDKNRGVNAVDGVNNGWYKNYTDWRLPYNTRIYGGCFFADVYRCDAAAEQGSVPIYIVSNGSTADTTYLCERTEYLGSALNGGTYAVNTNGTLKTSATTKDYQVKKGTGKTTWDYKIQYMTPNADKKVYLYCPTDKCGDTPKGYIHNYTTALVPLGEYHMTTNMMTMGGDVEVKARYQGLQKQVNAYMLYTQLNYYTRMNGGISFMNGVRRTINDEMQIKASEYTYTNTGNRQTDVSSVVFANVTNEAAYRIEYGMYMMLPVMSDQWFMLSPAFDVANVYVLETTTERGSKDWTDAQWTEYYKRQGTADGDMAQVLVTSVLPDVFSGKGSGVLKPLPDILNNMTNKSTRLRPITHFDGTNFMSANYYLNVLKSDINGEHKWEKQIYQELYGNNWQAAPTGLTPKFMTGQDLTCEDILDCDDIELPYKTQDNVEIENPKIIMQKGNIYSLYFPGGTGKYYDYKYIILEGYGPQMIDGTQKHDGFYSAFNDEDHNYVGDDLLGLQGNYTLATADISGLDATHPLFYIDPTQGSRVSLSPYYYFVADDKSTQRILPSRVYMVTNSTSPTKAAMPMLRHGESAPDTADALPTIASETASLEAWADKGIMLRAYEQQTISIYSIDGQLIWSGALESMQTKHIPASTGIYLIQGEETTVKLIVGN